MRKPRHFCQRRRRGQSLAPVVCIALGCGMLLAVFFSLRLFLLLLALGLIAMGCRGFA